TVIGTQLYAELLDAISKLEKERKPNMDGYYRSDKVAYILSFLNKTETEQKCILRKMTGANASLDFQEMNYAEKVRILLYKMNKTREARFDDSQMKQIRQHIETCILTISMVEVGHEREKFEMV
ncbi:hypothetical protein PMAYCL1PPCAC_31804, partial [Pristionchus mayeri]